MSFTLGLVGYLQTNEFDFISSRTGLVTEILFDYEMLNG